MAVGLKKFEVCAGRSNASVVTVFAPKMIQYGPKLEMFVCAAEMLEAPPHEGKFMVDVARLPRVPLGTPLVNCPFNVVTPRFVATATSPAPSPLKSFTCNMKVPVVPVVNEEDEKFTVGGVGEVADT
jgi:hypothetical protein